MKWIQIFAVLCKKSRLRRSHYRVINSKAKNRRHVPFEHNFNINLVIPSEFCDDIFMADYTLNIIGTINIKIYNNDARKIIYLYVIELYDITF